MNSAKEQQGNNGDEQEKGKPSESKKATDYLRCKVCGRHHDSGSDGSFSDCYLEEDFDDSDKENEAPSNIIFVDIFEDDSGRTMVKYKLRGGSDFYTVTLADAYEIGSYDFVRFRTLYMAGREAVEAMLDVSDDTDSEN